jgi:cytoskeleton protein RodZ
MSEKTENTEETQEFAAAKSAGSMLREAREAAKLSIDEVASELHLVSGIVTALENGDRSKLPSRVFTLGYIKNYAKLVNIPYEQVKTAFDDFTDDGIPVLNQPRARQIPDQSTGSGWLIKAIGWMILFGLLLLAFLWWKGEVSIPGVDIDFPLREQPQTSSGEIPATAEPAGGGTTLDAETNQQILLPPVESPDMTDSATDAGISSESLPVATDNSAVVTAEESGQTPLEEVPAAETGEPSLQDAPATEAGNGLPVQAIGIPLETAIEKPAALDQLDRIADAGSTGQESATDLTGAGAEDVRAATESPQKNIRISFSASCWVQVTDSNGEVVLSGEMRDGDTTNIEGDAPFRFVLGNAEAVELLVGSKRFDLEPYTSGNVARFTLEAREG